MYTHTIWNVQFNIYFRKMFLFRLSYFKYIFKILK